MPRNFQVTYFLRVDGDEGKAILNRAVKECRPRVEARHAPTNSFAFFYDNSFHPKIYFIDGVAYTQREANDLDERKSLEAALIISRTDSDRVVEDRFGQLHPFDPSFQEVVSTTDQPTSS